MKQILKSITAAFLLLPTTVYSQNPVVQTSCTPDPAPMVHNNTMYMYTGVDEDNSDWFYMNKWKVFSTTDMVNWTDHGVQITLDSFEWADDRAWAAQCIERNGKFYWYVCCKSKLSNTMALGVAVSSSPTGPFKDALGKPLIEGSWDYIDPTAFIDDDGQAYLYWGNPNVYCALLNDDMLSIKGDVIKLEQCEDSFGAPGPDKRVKEKAYKDCYTEGPWLNKKDGKYYLLYAAGGVPEQISYSMSDSPTGPWKYMGNIMPLQQTNSFTNHCGVADYKGNSYFFYHTGMLPGGGGFNRSSAIEQFVYNADGTFPIINMTEKGVEPVGTINPYKKNEAETIAFSEFIKSDQNSKTGVYVCAMRDSAYIKVREVDFGKKSPKKVYGTFAGAIHNAVVEVRIDSMQGDVIALFDVTSTGGWENWKESKSNLLRNVTGVHDLYFVFRGPGNCRLINFDNWRFAR